MTGRVDGELAAAAPRRAGRWRDDRGDPERADAAAQPVCSSPGFGLMALFAILVNTIMVGFVSGGGSLPTRGARRGVPHAGRAGGPVGVHGRAGRRVQHVRHRDLSFWAVVTAGDYSSGLIRLLVAAEPRRWRLLAGKVAALAIVTAVATTIAAAVKRACGHARSQRGGHRDGRLGNQLGLGSGLSVDEPLPRVVCVGVLGLVIAVLTRSAAVAVSIGIGYVLVVESTIKMAKDVPSDWLLGTTLGAVASGGTAAVAYGTALALALVYVTLGLVLAGVVFVLPGRDRLTAVAAALRRPGLEAGSSTQARRGNPGEAHRGDPRCRPRGRLRPRLDAGDCEGGRRGRGHRIYRHFPDKASPLFFAAVLEANDPIVSWVVGFPSREPARAPSRGTSSMPRCSSRA